MYQCGEHEDEEGGICLLFVGLRFWLKKWNSSTSPWCRWQVPWWWYAEAVLCLCSRTLGSSPRELTSEPDMEGCDFCSHQRRNQALRQQEWHAKILSTGNLGRVGREWGWEVRLWGPGRLYWVWILSCALSKEGKNPQRGIDEWRQWKPGDPIRGDCG